jgi:hypothetical protein
VRSQVLIAPARGVSPVISAQLDAALSNYYSNNMTSTSPRIEKPRLQFAHIRSLYPRFQYTDIASHAAIVILPYQVHPALPSLPTFSLYFFFIYFSSSPFSTLSFLFLSHGIHLQVSFMSLFEFYRMGVPLFVPSPLLLTEWHMRYDRSCVLSERHL